MKRDIDSPTSSIRSCSVYQSPSPSSSPSSSSSHSPRCSSPTNQAYDDMDDYSPVVSDIEEQNDDETDSRSFNSKFKRCKDDIEKDNMDIMEKILNEQSASKCELEEGNISDQGDNDDTEELKESKFQHFLKIKCQKILIVDKIDLISYLKYL